MIINVSGKSKVWVDNGREWLEIDLDRPQMGLYLPAMIWKDMYGFSEDSVLLVMASEYYDAKKYIRDYNDYMREILGDVGTRDDGILYSL